MIAISPKHLVVVAGAGSAVLLLAVFGFQVAGYAPCNLCILQRWPHAAAIIISGIALFTRHIRFFSFLGMLAAMTTAGIAIYHSGVEMSWWAGPASCSGGTSNLANISVQDLMTQLQNAPVIRCGDVAWRFLGLSMASWNAILSAGLAGVWGMAAKYAR